MVTMLGAHAFRLRPRARLIDNFQFRSTCVRPAAHRFSSRKKKIQKFSRLFEFGEYKNIICLIFFKNTGKLPEHDRDTVQLGDLRKLFCQSRSRRS